ncbi:MAG: FkbM family methyltransferase [Parvicellaceae bacterium]|jgi:FkbM family methyltransferase
MKNELIKLLHLILGYQNYLRLFTRFKIRFLRYDSRKSDFLFFEKLVTEQANIIIIGANTGITTIPFAKEKSERKVFAYEPVPSNFETLQNCVQYYSVSNIQNFMIALGNKTGEDKMILPVLSGAKKHGMAHIDHHSINSLEQGENIATHMDKLDNRIELENLKIDAIKIVAENYETEIFKGAQNIITKDKPFIYCELWDNENRIKTMNLIKEYGYQIFYREGENLKPYSNANYKGKNFFFKAK